MGYVSGFEDLAAAVHGVLQVAVQSPVESPKRIFVIQVLYPESYVI